jgi:redox-sensitive bicupin YhaK (pirin superfamily)
MATTRSIQKVFTAIEVSEGAGARVRRAIPTPKLRHLTPFVMLDHFASPANQIGNFPDHPHRGQEIVSYILSGATDHEDFLGNKGTIGPGSLQFMTAGRGIMHAEQPRRYDTEHDADDSLIEGLQLWIDMPAQMKYVVPRYRDLRAEDIPIARLDDGRVTVKVIAGESHGVVSQQDLGYTPIWYLDVVIHPGGQLQQIVPRKWNAFAYILSGRVSFDSSSSFQYRFDTVVFVQEGDVLDAMVPKDADKPAHFIIFAGEPLDQDIVQYGPFVLSSQEEVYQAISDFQLGQNGFERALMWKSDIQRRLN